MRFPLAPSVARRNSDSEPAPSVKIDAPFPRVQTQVGGDNFPAARRHAAQVSRTRNNLIPDISIWTRQPPLTSCILRRGSKRFSQDAFLLRGYQGSPGATFNSAARSNSLAETTSSNARTSHQSTSSLEPDLVVGAGDDQTPPRSCLRA